MNKLKRCIFAFLTFVFSSSIWANNFAQAVSDDTMSYIGIITAVVALIGTIVNYWSFKRKQYSNLVTAERLRFVKDWRECSARFCELLIEPKECTHREGQKNSIEYYYYKLVFMCNPTKPESYVDIEVVSLLEQLYVLYEEIHKNDCKEKEKKEQELMQKKKQFVALIQTNIAIEWQGITAESRKGKLSEEQKEDIRQEHYMYYLNRMKTINV